MTSEREFIDRHLAAIRKEFFADKTDREFFQERNMLEQAITFPAKWLHDRGSVMRSVDYDKIIATVLGTIRAHGNKRRIERVSAYLLHCTEEHMRHHGEEYYYAAKSVAADVAAAMHSMHAPRDRDVVPVLAGVYATLHAGQRGGRRRIRKAVESQPELI